ncbi:MAG TPA: methylmalonyl Co-A mutase-associated GTPase MeaB [Candidatus Limnocylindrales bacterium]|nr:methylmalonyl Co-A mutase-associated GTPase MeaB [Candidatus Limnocylindrales bacterium]
MSAAPRGAAAPASKASPPTRPTPPPLAGEILKGDPRSLARGMTLVENGTPEAEALLDAVYGKKPAAPRVGFTGPPGAGKSTLVAEYARLLRSQGHTVGVIAVDPTSPFTGGAILGDRVRMGEHATDGKVFIRSMATRGSLGGLAARTAELAELLDAWGSETTLIETVGVGQSELDVAETADTTIVVLTPESGDAIQTLKAGLMEIADVLVLNKADNPGADQMTAALRSSLAFRPQGGFKPPIVRTIATERKGIEELHAAIAEHRAWAVRPEQAARLRKERVRSRLRHAVREGLLDSWAARQGLESWIEAAADQVLAGGVSPYRAARDVIERMTRHGGNAS